MALLNEINVKGVPHPIVTDDGYYQEMTVGDAEQLVATTFTEDDAPYNFRTAGGAIDIGDRKQVEGIVGVSLPWNQIAPARTTSYTARGITVSTSDSKGVVTITGTRESDGWLGINEIPYLANHKVLALANKFTKGATQSVTGTSLALLDGYTQNHSFDVRDYQIFVKSSDTTLRFAVGGSTGDVYDASVISQTFDLTQMFGSAIADAIYALEQSNAGAGVAWFKKYFPKPYYAYNAGELMSVKALRHITVGFNAWDEEWELGDYDVTTGLPNTANTRIRSKNLIPIVPNTRYYFSAQPTLSYSSWLIFCFYDANKNYLSYSSPSANAAFTTPANAHYMHFCTSDTWGGKAYTGGFCINLSWDGERDGEYEEYVEHVYELDPDLELRGIPKLSAGNDLYYDGDIYEPDGTVTRKYGIIDLGTLEWSERVSDSSDWLAPTPNDSAAPRGNGGAESICAKYERLGENGLPTDKKMIVNSTSLSSASKWILIKDTAYSTAAAFKTAMNGVYLVYELAEPTEESADPYNGTQIVDDFGTEEYVDAGVAAETRDVAIPVGHNSLYQPNLRAKLEMVPEAPEDNGYYVVYHHDGINEYVPLIIPQELPDLPTEDGTYTLKCTVASGSATLSFESEV